MKPSSKAVPAVIYFDPEVRKQPPVDRYCAPVVVEDSANRWSMIVRRVGDARDGGWT